MEAALPGEDFDGKLPAVFAGHRPLDALYDGRDRAAIVLELLGAILDGNSHPLTNVFVVCALVRVLKSAPAAYVIYQDSGEVGGPILDISYQLLERIPPTQTKTTFALIRVSADDDQTSSCSVLLDRL